MNTTDDAAALRARITELEAETHQWDAAHEVQWERAERAEALRDRAQLDRDAAEVRANRAEAALAELRKAVGQSLVFLHERRRAQAQETLREAVSGG